MTASPGAGGAARIRPARRTDAPALARIYREAIRVLGPAHYQPEQVAAWSAMGDDETAFREWLDGARIWVAERETPGCVGFAGLQEPDRIASLFVAPAATRQGVGTALTRHLLSQLRRRGVHRVATEASEFSRPVFERAGFRVVEVECTRVRGVVFQRYAMCLEGGDDV